MTFAANLSAGLHARLHDVCEYLITCLPLLGVMEGWKDIIGNDGGRNDNIEIEGEKE